MQELTRTYLDFSSVFASPRLLASIVAVTITAGAAGACAGPSTSYDVASHLSGRPQSRPLTCESRSAADLLSFHGIAASEADVFGRIARSDNPDTGFVGDPDGPPGRLPPEGYGVHAEPVAAALIDLGLDAQASRGRSYEWLEEQTREARPVIVWITASCDLSKRAAMSDTRGRAFSVARGEHTVLVVSADGSGVTVVDPAGGFRRQFERAEFEAAWTLFDRMAISARGPRPANVVPSK